MTEEFNQKLKKLFQIQTAERFINKFLNGYSDITLVNTNPINSELIYLIKAYHWYQDNRDPQYKYYKHPNFNIDLQNQLELRKFKFTLFMSFFTIAVWNILLHKYKLGFSNLFLSKSRNYKIKNIKRRFMFPILLMTFTLLEESDFGIQKYFFRKQINLENFITLAYPRNRVKKKLLYYNISL